MNSVEWGEFKLGDLFEITSTRGFNKDVLTDGYEYDYVTRTSQNQGILQTTGFVNKEHINPAGVWSLGLLQMDFFYRYKPWYAGQFVRQIIPNMKLTQNSILYMTALLNKQKENLLSVLVRDVDSKFKNTIVSLPVKNGKIDFDFIDSFIAELEEERIAELEAYLTVAGLKDYELTTLEQKAIDNYQKLEFIDFKVTDIFTVKNSGNILSRDIVENSGNTPYLCASRENNSVSSYISYDSKYLENGNCIFIGGKTFVVTYQEFDFYSNDSHNLILYLKNEKKRDKLTQLYLATCINKSLGHKYSWGNSISNKKIQNDRVALPVNNGQPDLSSMAILISAIQKLVIKDVVLFTEQKLQLINS